MARTKIRLEFFDILAHLPQKVGDPCRIVFCLSHGIRTKCQRMEIENRERRLRLW